MASFFSGRVEVQDATGQGTQSAIRNVRDAERATTQANRRIEQSLEGTAEANREAERASEKNTQELLDQVRAANKAEAEFDDLAKELGVTSRELRTIQKESGATVDDLRKLERAAEDAGDGLEDIGGGDGLGGAVDGLGGAVDGLKGKLGGLAGPAAIGGAVTGLVALGVKGAATAKDLERVSVISGLSASELQMMGRAAREGGGDIEDVADAAREMQLRLAEAASLGTGPAVDALELLGVTLEDLDPMETGEQFAFLRDRISEVEDPAQRMFLAEELFGGSVERLNSLLATQSDELDTLGGNTDEEIARAADAQAAFDRFGDVVEDLSITLASKLAPVLEKVADNLDAILVVGAGVLRWGGRALDWLLPFDNAWKAVTNTARVFQGDLGSVDDALVGLIETFPGVELVSDGVRKVWDWMGQNEGPKVIETVEGLTDRVNDARQPILEYGGNWLDSAGDATAATNDIAHQAEIDFERAAKAAGFYSGKLVDLQEEAWATADVLAEVWVSRRAVGDDLSIGALEGLRAGTLSQQQSRRTIWERNNPTTGGRGGGGGGGSSARDEEREAAEETREELARIGDAADRFAYFGEQNYHESLDALQDLYDSGRITDLEFAKQTDRTIEAFARAGHADAQLAVEAGKLAEDLAEGTNKEIRESGGKVVRAITSCMCDGEGGGGGRSRSGGEVYNPDGSLNTRFTDLNRRGYQFTDADAQAGWVGQEPNWRGGEALRPVLERIADNTDPNFGPDNGSVYGTDAWTEMLRRNSGVVVRG